MPQVIGPVRPKVAGAFKVVDAGDLGGAFIKSVTANGLATVQLADGTEAPVQITGSGGGLDQGQVDARIAAASIPTTQLTGAFIKSITTAGLATVQLADGTETDRSGSRWWQWDRPSSPRCGCNCSDRARHARGVHSQPRCDGSRGCYCCSKCSRQCPDRSHDSCSIAP